MRIDSAGLLACACAALVATTAGMTACLLHQQEADNAVSMQDQSLALPPLAASYRPSPGWLHVSGMPGMFRQGSDDALHALTSTDSAATIRWWTPLP
jgi:hypothetical protein